MTSLTSLRQKREAEAINGDRRLSFWPKFTEAENKIIRGYLGNAIQPQGNDRMTNLEMTDSQLQSPAGQLAIQIAAEIEPSDDSTVQNPMLIGIIIELLPMIGDILTQFCNPDADTIQDQANKRGKVRRRNSTWINWKTRRTQGREIYSLLGGDNFGGHVLDVLAKQANKAAIQGTLETPPPKWGMFDD